MEKKFMTGLWAGVYVGTICAILYIYKKNMDKQNAQYASYMSMAEGTWRVNKMDNDPEKIVEE